jgi:glycosyltransferase involved in cell wall biosynthesis
MQPDVSVIIPTYNRANYLKKSIQSVLDQTFSNFEIIVVNNFSTDDTLEVISSLNDSRIKVINFHNGGIIAKARNQGIIKSVGKYISFLDDDDLWCSNKLEIQVKFLYDNPDIQIIYSNAFIVDEFDNKKDLLLNKEQPKSGHVFPDLLYENFVPILTVLMKREVYEEIGLFIEDIDVKGSEDYEYWLRTALSFNFGYIDSELALYRVHSGSVSNSINRPLIWQKVLNLFLINSDVPVEYKDKIVENIERINADVSVYYWSISDKKKAKDYARRYIDFSYKMHNYLNVFIGVVLFALVHFQYFRLISLVKFASRVRRPLNL